MNMKMRNFFSPFTSLSSNDFEEQPIKVGMTLFTQNNKRVFLVTTSNKEVLESTLRGKAFAMFSSAYRDGKACLVIEGCDKREEAKMIPNKSYLTFRASGCVFLPLENHKRRELTAYLTTVGDGQQIIVIPLPDDYRLHNIAKEKPTSQPYVEKWPPFT